MGEDSLFTLIGAVSNLGVAGIFVLLFFRVYLPSQQSHQLAVQKQQVEAFHRTAVVMAEKFETKFEALTQSQIQFMDQQIRAMNAIVTRMDRIENAQGQHNAALVNLTNILLLSISDADKDVVAAVAKQLEDIKK